MNATELVGRLENGEISLLKSFRVKYGHFLKKIIFGPRPPWQQVYAIITWTLGLLSMKYIVGPICRFVLWCILTGDNSPKDASYWRRKREKAVRIVRLFFPDNIIGTPPDAGSRGLIVGFNHPTLHEIFSLVAWTLTHYPEKRNNFPTNLPWYESVCTRAPVLKKLGVCITPLITQSTFNKLKKVHQGDEETINVITRVSELLLNHYFDQAVAFERTGDNTFSAPSATRQVTIFPKNEVKLLPAMSTLLFKIARANKSTKPAVLFLPVTVIPPRFRIKWLKGIKPFRRYCLKIGEGFTMEEAKALGRGIDYAFLQRLSENAPKELWYPKTAT